MTDTFASNMPAGEIPCVPGIAPGTPEEANFEDHNREDHNRVGRLLAGLRESAPSVEMAPQSEDAKFENQLALVRLGMATSLFYALRTKHAPTAAHSLRVALVCSAWAQQMRLDEPTRDRIEVAALLHDLGKIGIPDRILRKPGKLSVDEQLVMECCSQLGCEILRGCTSDQELLNIVLHANRWFHSRRDEHGPRGAELPLGSRMLAIADAFDAMTTDTVYRPALSRERAIQELIDGSGSQFDPELAIGFHQMLEQRPELLQGVVANRWLQQLQPSSGDSLWGSSTVPSTKGNFQIRRETLFYQQLIHNMKEGVAFTDREGTITEWNSVMERMTGIAQDAIVGQSWSNQSVHLCEHAPATDPDDTEEKEELLDRCLVDECLDTGAPVARSMLIKPESGAARAVHVHVSPVIGETPGIHGAVVVVRDLSDENDLVAQIESLHLESTRDPLTGLTNRGFFDGALEELTAISASGGPTYSLIICDIDYFKRVNDTYGHPAGDDALRSFSSLLESYSREGDMVARYGGEEFVLLAPNCDNATAAKRAEAIRQACQKNQLASIGDEAITASFGVTEYQAGDTAETVLARADRALLKAKDNGRNRVIQLGSGNQAQPAETDTKKGWRSWFSTDDPPQEGNVEILTPVPADLAIEKLRGFIADHTAEIISVDENEVSLKLNALCAQGGRRPADHQIAIRVHMTLNEMDKDPDKPLAWKKTRIHINLQPIRNRDRRNNELSACFTQVVASLKSYLMGEIQKTDLR